MTSTRPAKRQRVSPASSPRKSPRTTTHDLTDRHASAVSDIDQAMQQVEQAANRARKGSAVPLDDLYRRRSTRELTRPRQILRDLTVNTKNLHQSSAEKATKPNDRPARSPTASPTALADQQYQHNLSLKPNITDELRRRLLQPAHKTPVHRLERYSDSQLGECVRTLSAISVNDFVVEYGGEVLTAKEARKREDEYSERPDGRDPGCYLFYFDRANRHYCIDGTDPKPEYGLARYINHSVMKCNLYARSVFDSNKKVHLVFFAARDIAKGETLWIDYGDRQNVDAFPWLLG